METHTNLQSSEEAALLRNVRTEDFFQNSTWNRGAERTIASPVSSRTIGLSPFQKLFLQQSQKRIPTVFKGLFLNPHLFLLRTDDGRLVSTVGLFLTFFLSPGGLFHVFNREKVSTHTFFDLKSSACLGIKAHGSFLWSGPTLTV